MNVVKNLLLKSKRRFDGREIGDIQTIVNQQMIDAINKIVQQNYDACIKVGQHIPNYYIHIFLNTHQVGAGQIGVKIHSRRTRPSPYQEEDHILYKVTNYDHIEYVWNIPKREYLAYILANPNEFDKDYVTMIRQYLNDKLEKLEDYLVDGEIQ